MLKDIESLEDGFIRESYNENKYDYKKINKMFPELYNIVDKVVYPFSQCYERYILDTISAQYGKFICLDCRLLNLETIKVDIVITNDLGFEEEKSLIFKINLVFFENEFIVDGDSYSGDIDDFDVKEYLSKKFKTQDILDSLKIDDYKEVIIIYLINNHQEFKNMKFRINIKQKV